MSMGLCQKLGLIPDWLNTGSSKQRRTIGEELWLVCHAKGLYEMSFGSYLTEAPSIRSRLKSATSDQFHAISQKWCKMDIFTKEG